ncbi:hypothetical protein B0H14DRAFT_2622180 [Mycena olivaceomarginata]|nr:hypothetical protein B0H14DRAFT_2622180 [Mycena olivaceomarginata]
MYNATYVETEDRLQKSNCGCIDAVNTCFAEKNDDAELFLLFSTANINTGCSEASELASDPRWMTRALGRDHEHVPHVVQRTHGRHRELRVQRLLRGMEVLPHASNSIESPVSATVANVRRVRGIRRRTREQGRGQKELLRCALDLRRRRRARREGRDEWGRLGVVGVVAGVPLPPDAASVDVHRGVKRGMAGGREGGVVEVGEERDSQTNLGLRLEFVAEVRRAVGKGSARPNMVKGRRRKVSSGFWSVTETTRATEFVIPMPEK